MQHLKFGGHYIRSLQSKVVMMTGRDSGLGQALALQLNRAGAYLAYVT